MNGARSFGVNPGASAAAVAAHEADTTNVHGIADTTVLETTTGSAAKVSTHVAASDPHGDRAAASSALTAHVAASDPHGDRAFSGRNPGWFNVKDYGAVGDGVADDTAAIQAALAAAGATGALAYLPHGIYKVTSTLTLPTRATLVGSGWQALSQASYGGSQWTTNPATSLGGSVILSTVTSGSAIFGDDSVAARWTLRDFAVVGPGSGTSVGIRLADTGSFNIRPNISNVFVANFAVGLRVGTTNQARLDSVTAYACATGVYLGPAFNDNTITNLEIQRTTTDGLVFDASSGNQVVGGLLQNCAGTAALRVAAGSVGNALQGFWAEAVTATNTALLGGETALRDWHASTDTTPIRATVGGCSFDRVSAPSMTPVLDSGTRQHIISRCSFAGLSATGAGYVRVGDGDQLVVAPYAGQSADLLVLLDEAGAIASRFDHLGVFVANNQIVGYSGFAANWLRALAADKTALFVQAAASQSADLVAYSDSDGNTKAGVTAAFDLVAGRTLRPGGGATGSRPSAATVGAGALWFDTTLGKLIWSDGSSWTVVNALYSSVPAADGAVGAVGSATTPSPGDHAHPRYAWGPTDHGFLTWNADIYLGSSSFAPTVAGTLNIVRLHVPVACSVTNVCLAMVVAGATLTTGQCFAALYTAAGAKVGVTADQASNWGSGLGVKSMALVGGPFALSAGDHYVAFWYNGTTSPAWLRYSALGGGYLNVGLSAPNLRVATADTGLTTAAPTTLGTQTAAGVAYWAALS